MTAIGNLSLALNTTVMATGKKTVKKAKAKTSITPEKPGRISSKNSNGGSAESQHDRMLNRRKNSKSRASADAGIDEFGHSENIKLYGWGEAEKIKQNPGAKGPLESTVLSVAQKELCIVIPKKYKKNRKAKILAEFMELNHEQMDGDITDALIELGLPGMWYGNNILEPTYMDLPWDESTSFPGMRIYKALTGKFPGLWELKETEYNEVYGIESGLTRQVFPIENFILFTWLRQYGRNKGSAIYDSVFKYLKAKDVIHKKSIIYINKFAGKIPVGRYQNAADADFALELAEAVYDGTAIALPEEITLEFIDVLGTGSAQDAFLVLFNWCDSQANLAIKGTSGLAVNNGTGSGTGSNASDEVKERKESIYEWYLQKKLQEIWYEQICKRIIEFNFDKKQFPEYLYPRVEFKEIKKLTLEQKQANIKLGCEIQVLKPVERVDDEIFIREELSFPPIPDKVIKLRREKEAEMEIQITPATKKVKVSKTKVNTEEPAPDNPKQIYSISALYYYPALKEVA
jgi:hypothetical protein